MGKGVHRLPVGKNEALNEGRQAWRVRERAKVKPRAGYLSSTLILRNKPSGLMSNAAAKRKMILKYESSTEGLVFTMNFIWLPAPLADV